MWFLSRNYKLLMICADEPVDFLVGRWLFTSIFRIHSSDMRTYKLWLSGPSKLHIFNWFKVLPGNLMFNWAAGGIKEQLLVAAIGVQIWTKLEIWFAKVQHKPLHICLVFVYYSNWNTIAATALLSPASQLVFMLSIRFDRKIAFCYKPAKTLRKQKLSERWKKLYMAKNAISINKIAAQTIIFACSHDNFVLIFSPSLSHTLLNKRIHFTIFLLIQLMMMEWQNKHLIFSESKSEYTIRPVSVCVKQMGNFSWISDSSYSFSVCFFVFRCC